MQLHLTFQATLVRYKYCSTSYGAHAVRASHSTYVLQDCLKHKVLRLHYCFLKRKKKEQLENQKPNKNKEHTEQNVILWHLCMCFKLHHKALFIYDRYFYLVISLMWLSVCILWFLYKSYENGFSRYFEVGFSENIMNNYFTFYKSWFAVFQFISD